MNLYVTLISYVVAVNLGFGTAWYIQDLRSIEDENNRIKVTQQEERRLYEVEQERSFARIAAESAAKVRESKLRVDAAAARAESDRLRNSISIAVQAARSVAANCPDTAATLGELFGQCAARYSDLGEKAGRHANDIQTMIDAAK